MNFGVKFSQGILGMLYYNKKNKKQIILLKIFNRWVPLRIGKNSQRI